MEGCIKFSVRLAFPPNFLNLATLVSVHLDPASQQVITPEERTLGQLTEEFAKYDTGFRPPYGLQVSAENDTGTTP